jgi:hypothetical protein
LSPSGLSETNRSIGRLVLLLLRHGLPGYPVVGAQYPPYEARVRTLQCDMFWATANGRNPQQNTTPPSTMTKDSSTIGAPSIGAPPLHLHRSTPMPWSYLQLLRQQPADVPRLRLRERPIRSKLAVATPSDDEIGRKRQLPAFLPQYYPPGVPLPHLPLPEHLHRPRHGERRIRQNLGSPARRVVTEIPRHASLPAPPGGDHWPRPTGRRRHPR